MFHREGVLHGSSMFRPCNERAHGEVISLDFKYIERIRREVVYRYAYLILEFQRACSNFRFLDVVISSVTHDGRILLKRKIAPSIRRGRDLGLARIDGGAALNYQHTLSPVVSNPAELHHPVRRADNFHGVSKPTFSIVDILVPSVHVYVSPFMLHLYVKVPVLPSAVAAITSYLVFPEV